MEYRVELSLCAERDLEEAFDYIRGDSPAGAVNWRKRLEKKLRILERMPESFGFAPENHDAQAQIRQLLFGRYRILYTLRGSTVFMLTIRHGAREFLLGRELDSVE